MAEEASNVNEVQAVLRSWENEKDTPGYNPIPALTKFVHYLNFFFCQFYVLYIS